MIKKNHEIDKQRKQRAICESIPAKVLGLSVKRYPKFHSPFQLVGPVREISGLI